MPSNIQSHIIFEVFVPACLHLDNTVILSILDPKEPALNKSAGDIESLADEISPCVETSMRGVNVNIGT